MEENWEEQGASQGSEHSLPEAQQQDDRVEAVRSEYESQTPETGQAVRSEYESQTPETRESVRDAETGYTGEYGNRIRGEYQKPDQSTYSFSYKNGGGESTHSGDYYAEKPENRGDYHMGKQMHSGEDFSGQQKKEDGYTEAPYFGTAFSGESSSVRPPKKGKEKDGMSFGKRLAITAVCAVFFGVIASACFIGVNYVYQKNHPVNQQSAQTEVIQKTTDGIAEEKSSVTDTQNDVASGKTTIQSGVTDVSAIVEQTMPAIVAITSTTKGADYYDLFGQYYAGRDTTSAGTGFIVGQNDDELLIATNNHVISGAKTISVQFIDGEICEATEKGSDASNDLAVVAVERKNIKKTTAGKIRVADLGDSEKAKVGEMVVAIGNALGYGQSVTVGYISAKDREITEESESGGAQNKIKALQTDAAINPGNSGGALINLQGQVIGINSAKIASSSVEGVGYAIPISVATPIIDDLMKREVLKDNEKGYLGISGTTVSEAATLYNVPTGVYVKAVSKGGAADLAGIKENDIITAVNNMQVTTMESLKEKVNSYRVGTEVEITFQRSSDGEYKEQTVKVKLQDQSSTDGLPDGSAQGDDAGNNGNNGNGGNNNGSNNGRNDGNDGYGGGLWDFFQ